WRRHERGGQRDRVLRSSCWLPEDAPTGTRRFGAVPIDTTARFHCIERTLTAGQGALTAGKGRVSELLASVGPVLYTSTLQPPLSHLYREGNLWWRYPLAPPARPSPCSDRFGRPCRRRWRRFGPPMAPISS